MSTLTHNLTEYFPQLAEHNSIDSLESSPLFQKLRPEIEQVLAGHEHATLAEPVAPKEQYRAVAWNIERGTHLEGIIETLRTHPELSNADLYLITETDLGMARSRNRNVARELAEALQLNYFFAPSYLNLTKGCGHEKESDGENSLGIHGNAILSRYPIENCRTVELPNGKDKMRGNEKRIGHQRALIADIVLGDQTLTTSCIHLDAHSSQRHRAMQLHCILDQLAKNDAMLIGGDWNTNTYNSSRTLHAIIGLWIRAFMGTGNMIRNHYPHPYRFWEKELFEMLETRGFDISECDFIFARTIFPGHAILHRNVGFEDVTAVRSLTAGNFVTLQ